MRPKEAWDMDLLEEWVLLDGFKRHYSEEPSAPEAARPSGTPSASGFLNLDEMAAMGAEVSPL